MATDTKTISVPMEQGKETKTKVRYETDAEAPFDNIYVDKDVAARLGKSINVTIEPA